MAKLPVGLTFAGVTALVLGVAGTAFAVPGDGMDPAWCTAHPRSCGLIVHHHRHKPAPPVLLAPHPKPRPAPPVAVVPGPGRPPGDPAPTAPRPRVRYGLLLADPATTYPGGSVTLHTATGCPGAAETAGSPAFAAPVTLLSTGQGQYAATASVPVSTALGTYPLTAQCHGTTVATGSLTVAALGPLATGGGWTAHHPPTTPLALTGYGALLLTGAAATAGARMLVRRNRAGSTTLA